MMAEQNRIVKSRITKPSAKKVNCPAQIIFKEVITFPDYEVSMPTTGKTTFIIFLFFFSFLGLIRAHQIAKNICL